MPKPASTYMYYISLTSIAPAIYWPSVLNAQQVTGDFLPSNYIITRGAVTMPISIIPHLVYPWTWLLLFAVSSYIHSIV